MGSNVDQTLYSLVGSGQEYHAPHSCHKYLYIPLSHGFESVIEKLYVFDLNFCRNASPFVTIILDTLKNNSLLVGA